MRVLCLGNMYPPHHLGGYEVIWRSAVRHVRAAGHPVRVLTSDFVGGSGGPEDEDVHRELGWYWHEHDWPRLSARECLHLERANRAVLRRHLREFSPDVVSWWAMGGMSLSLIEQVRRLGLPSVGFVQDDWLVYGPQVDRWMRLGHRAGVVRPLLERVTGVPARAELAEAARWVFSSERVRQASRSHIPGLDGRILHVGIDPELFPARERPSWEWRLLVVGRIDPRKGIATAVRALAELPAQARLEVVGDGDETHLRELRALAAASGRVVRFRAAVDRASLAEVYAAADVVVFPVEWEEPWGLVPLEAMSCGVPVIATGRGGSAEYLRTDENCLAFTAGDASGLAVAVHRLAGDSPLRERLIQGGRLTAGRYRQQDHDEGVLEELLRAVS